jgi:hypothetical protein
LKRLAAPLLVFILGMVALLLFVLAQQVAERFRAWYLKSPCSPRSFGALPHCC